jgi:hypothetical protein
MAHNAGRRYFSQENTILRTTTTQDVIMAGEKVTASGFVPGTMYSLDSSWVAMFTAAFPETTLDTPDIYT